jgi:5'-methylthioadenosine phosphorylase
MDAGAEAEDAVTQEDVFALFAAHTERLKGLLAGVLADLPDPAGCTCDTWADGIDLTYDVP